MSGLLNEIKAMKVGRPSRLDLIFEQLGDKDAQELRQALDDPSIRIVQIQRALQLRGIKIHHALVVRYRGGL